VTVDGVRAQTPGKPDPDHVLTWRQRKILHAIRDSVQKRGYPPSMREIAQAVGLISTSSVSYQLAILERKGYLHRDVRRPRTMEIHLPAIRQPGQGAEEIPGHPARLEAVHVPLVGRIDAGGPLLAAKQIEEVFPLPRKLVGDGPVFMLRVAGDQHPLPARMSTEFAGIAGGFRAGLGLLAVRIGAGIGLAVHSGERRGGRGPAFLLVLVLLRFLLFLVASHLTLSHGRLLRFADDSSAQNAT